MTEREHGGTAVRGAMDRRRVRFRPWSRLPPARWRGRRWVRPPTLTAQPSRVRCPPVPGPYGTAPHRRGARCTVAAPAVLSRGLLGGEREFGPDGLAAAGVAAAPALGELGDDEQTPAPFVGRPGAPQVRGGAAGVADLADQVLVADQPQVHRRGAVANRVGDQLAHHQLGGDRGLLQPPGGQVLASQFAGLGDDGGGRAATPRWPRGRRSAPWSGSAGERRRPAGPRAPDRAASGRTAPPTGGPVRPERSTTRRTRRRRHGPRARSARRCRRRGHCLPAHRTRRPRTADRPGPTAAPPADPGTAPRRRGSPGPGADGRPSASSRARRPGHRIQAGRPDLTRTAGRTAVAVRALLVIHAQHEVVEVREQFVGGQIHVGQRPHRRGQPPHGGGRPDAVADHVTTNATRAPGHPTTG